MEWTRGWMREQVRIAEEWRAPLCGDCGPESVRPRGAQGPRRLIVSRSQVGLILRGTEGHEVVLSLLRCHGSVLADGVV